MILVALEGPEADYRERLQPFLSSSQATIIDA